MVDDFDLRGFGNQTPLFPLAGVVLFPHTVLPLHIFEPRYRQMTQDALAGDRGITIVQPRGVEDAMVPGQPALEEFACLGQILNCKRLADGRYNCLLVGRKRVRVTREVPSSKLYRVAEIEVLEDEPADDESARAELVTLFRDLARRQEVLDDDLGGLLSGDVGLGPLTDIVAHSLGLPAALKQSFLADLRVDRRAAGLIRILRELAAPEVENLAPHRRYPPPISLN